jgi:alkyldihydroxyacetonephosphate synthase
MTSANTPPFRPTRPTPPIELTPPSGGPVTAHYDNKPVEVPEDLMAALDAICEVVSVDGGTAGALAVAEASRDWWPLALHWSLRGEVPQLADLVARPTSTANVVDVVQACNVGQVPLTAAGGRSGVCGASVPVFGGVVLDMTALHGIKSVDAVSGIVEVLPGTFGPDLERVLNDDYGLSVGHFPQSFELATVGGWVAARGAGQFSTRYGKIEDMVVGLEVVLANGTVIRTGGAPAAASGPDLTQMIVGSEGTLGVITNVWLKTHPLPAAEQRAAYVFDTFEQGVEACRSTMRAGATPAVLRLYDGPESARGRGGDGNSCTLLVLDEGDARLVEATMGIVADACAAAGGVAGDVELVEAWMRHRNDTSALQGLTRKGFVVDTMEIAAPWSKLGGIFDAVREGMLAVPHARAATCHLSHSYSDGACLYFTFAATPPADDVESNYVAMWDVGTRAVLANGGNLSHHHGVGLNRNRFVAEALGETHVVMQQIKDTLDPNGILNPGKLGLSSPFGETPWP